MTQPLRVLHITYDMGIGGTEQVIKNLITGCDPACVAHHVCCLESPLGPWGEMLQESGIPVFAFNRSPKLDRKLIRQIRRIILELKIQVVHAHQYTPFTYGFFASKRTSAKLIFTEHGRFYPDSSTFKRRMVNRALFPFVDKVTAISEATKQAMVAYERIPAKNIEVIYNGIHAIPLCEADELRELRASLGIPEDAFIFGTIARFDTIKNQPLMLKGFAQALVKHPNIHLVMVGDGPERENLERLVKELRNIGHSVHFTGYQPQPTRYINLFDVFLLTSLSEGTSMTLLEAMSAGKPCIVSNAGGNPEIVVHQKNGLVFPSNNGTALAHAMIQIIESEALRTKFSAEALGMFDQRFTAAVMQRRFLEIYQQLAGAS
jgi:glycosyltransferase involved in cell wall biosynthesis